MWGRVAAGLLRVLTVPRACKVANAALAEQTALAYSYKIRKRAGLVLTSAWDVLNAEEVLEFRTRIREDPDFRPDLYQLLDFSRLAGIDIDSLTIMGLARDHVFSPKS